MGSNKDNADSATGAEVSGLPLWKRVLDFGIILFLAPGLILLGGLVALVVKFGSPGPVLFRQRRVGYKGREFVCFKFRTMLVNSDTTAHRDHTRQLISTEAPMVKLDAHKDPRLAPLGTLLRATGLDELPQLLNVLRGDMSIVGPRPCIPYEYELYEPWQRRRFDAVPGLTGLWQVSGKNRTTFNQMINLDIEYGKRASLGLDLKIILKTLPALWVQCADTRAARRASASGEAHGQANGRAHVNGHLNGESHANGHAIANGHANGSMKTNGNSLPATKVNGLRSKVPARASASV
jgi:lipopolysaccharide/colanic/teichoic acid biosynthesis glycosyltransferase